MPTKYAKNKVTGEVKKLEGRVYDILVKAEDTEWSSSTEFEYQQKPLAYIPGVKLPKNHG